MCQGKNNTDTFLLVLHCTGLHVPPISTKKKQYTEILFIALASSCLLFPHTKNDTLRFHSLQWPPHATYFQTERIEISFSDQLEYEIPASLSLLSQKGRMSQVEHQCCAAGRQNLWRFKCRENNSG